MLNVIILDKNQMKRREEEAKWGEQVREKQSAVLVLLNKPSARASSGPRSQAPSRGALSQAGAAETRQRASGACLVLRGTGFAG